MATGSEKPSLRRELRRRSPRTPPQSAPSFASLVAGTATAAVPGSDSDPTPTILVVCTGNICRSPLGELLLRQRLAALGVRVHSAGTGALVGDSMARESQRVARDHGIDPVDAAAHRARALTEDMVMRADLTLTMTADHRADVISRAPSALRRVFTVREFAALAASLDGPTAADPAVAPRVRLAAAVARVAAQRGTVSLGAGCEDVFDPFGRSPDAYDESARQLLPAVDAVADVVRAALDAPAGAAG